MKFTTGRKMGEGRIKGEWEGGGGGGRVIDKGGGRGVQSVMIKSALSTSWKQPNESFLYVEYISVLFHGRYRFLQV